ncbi:MAG TPA: MBL fold metallo-hydrolase, partial [Albitalea sp.]|nr:MBL fold metallo-hydrolase [Albitalea sp.]
MYFRKQAGVIGFHQLQGLGLICRRIAAAVAGSAALAAGALAQPVLPPVTPVQVSPHAYFVQGQSALGSPKNANFISNAGFVVTDSSVVVIDALGSPALARELLAQIRRITAKPVSHLILTHYHADHVYGLQVFKEAGATIIANRHGQEYLESDTARLRLDASRKELAPWIDAQTQLVPADRWIDGDTELTVGGTRFVLRSAGPSHTPDDTVIYLPDEKVLFAGDVVFRA